MCILVNGISTITTVAIAIKVAGVSSKNELILDKQKTVNTHVVQKSISWSAACFAFCTIHQESWVPGLRRNGDSVRFWALCLTSSFDPGSEKVRESEQSCCTSQLQAKSPLVLNSPAQNRRLFLKQINSKYHHPDKLHNLPNPLFTED